MSNYMNELKTSLGELVSTRTTNCKEGNVPSNTEVFKNYIKLCTDDIINTAIAKKQEVSGRIKEEIDNKTVNPFTEIEAV